VQPRARPELALPFSGIVAPGASLASAVEFRCAAADSGVFRANSSEFHCESAAVRLLRCGLSGLGACQFRLALSSKLHQQGSWCPVKSFTGQPSLRDLISAHFSIKIVKKDNLQAEHFYLIC
jgi:hypothetical protein